MRAFQLLLGLAQEAGIGDGVAVRVCVELLQPHINAHLRACGDVFHFALCLHRELCVVAISPLDDAHLLDLFERERGNLLFLVANQSEPPNAARLTWRGLT